MSDERFDGWAILELMGHRRLAGRVSEATFAGGSFLRIDVPGDPPVTQFYSPSSVYAITPCTEEVALRVAKHERPAPVHAFEFPVLPARATRDDAAAGGDF